MALSHNERVELEELRKDRDVYLNKIAYLNKQLDHIKLKLIV